LKTNCVRDYVTKMAIFNTSLWRKYIDMSKLSVKN
jgi:hypothetical protein